MRAVLISIQPKWCELIASGKKTIEVRKTRPKLNTPFKVYIYCTKAKVVAKYIFRPEDYPEYMRPDKTVFCKGRDTSSPFCDPKNGNGKVIGEFVCDKIYNYYADDFVGAEDVDGTIRTEPKEGEFAYWIPDEKSTCLTYAEILRYGNGKTLYGWHISDLKIYDQPKELSQFIIPSYGHGCVNDDECRGCNFFDRGNGFNVEDDCNAHFCTDDYKPMRKSPQSWCYVEQLQNEHSGGHHE